MRHGGWEEASLKTKNETCKNRRRRAAKVCCITRSLLHTCQIILKIQNPKLVEFDSRKKKGHLLTTTQSSARLEKKRPYLQMRA